MKSNNAFLGKAKKQEKAIQDGMCLLFIILMTIFFLRNVLLPGRMIGGRGDARLNNLIMEHWYKVFCGQETYNNLSMFYPLTNTVSYTDMLLGFSVPYSLLRALGVNMFLACKVVLVMTYAGGNICLYYLLRKVIGLQYYTAFTGVTAFAFAQGYANRIAHTQMIALSFVPLILIFLILCIRYFDHIKKRRIYMFLFLTSFILLAYTGWYCCYFSIIFSMIYIIAFIRNSLKFNKSVIMGIFGRIKRNIIELAVWCFYAVALMVPLLTVYIPTSKMNGGRNWYEVNYYLPELVDVFNVGQSNLLFGRVIKNLNYGAYRNKGEGELVEGFSVVLLIALVYLIYRFRKEYKEPDGKRKSKINGVSMDINQIIIGSLIFSIFFSVILILSSGGVSLWWVVYKILPGAGSLRAVVRYYFFLLLPMGILLAMLLERYQPKRNPERVIIAYALVLWVSNISTGTMGDWDYTVDQEMLSRIPAPPEQAEVMAICDSGAEYQEPYLNQLDAWMIADYYHIKTVNGYSGMFPPGWPLWDVTAIEYPSLVEQWKLSQGVEEQIWLYDRGTNTWALPPTACSDYPLPDRICQSSSR